VQCQEDQEPVEVQIHLTLLLFLKQRAQENKEINPLFHLLKVILEEQVMQEKEVAVEVLEHPVNQLLFQTYLLLHQAHLLHQLILQDLLHQMQHQEHMVGVQLEELAQQVQLMDHLFKELVAVEVVVMKVITLAIIDLQDPEQEEQVVVALLQELQV
tara:strand:- start:148 stop:618 length:471 start_codon:yes stop_codon:yes gene_type:complete